MPGCCAYGCSNSAAKGFLMKVFPRDPERRKLWEAKVKWDNWKSTSYSVLCEAHFEEHMWEKPRVDNKRKLRCNAVPTLFSFVAAPRYRKAPKNRTIIVESTDKPSASFARIDTKGSKPQLDAVSRGNATELQDKLNVHNFVAAPRDRKAAKNRTIIVDDMLVQSTDQPSTSFACTLTYDTSTDTKGSEPQLDAVSRGNATELQDKLNVHSFVAAPRDRKAAKNRTIIVDDMLVQSTDQPSTSFACTLTYDTSTDTKGSEPQLDAVSRDNATELQDKLNGHSFVAAPRDRKAAKNRTIIVDDMLVQSTDQPSTSFACTLTYDTSTDTKGSEPQLDAVSRDNATELQDKLNGHSFVAAPRDRKAAKNRTIIVDDMLVQSKDQPSTSFARTLTSDHTYTDTKGSEPQLGAVSRDNATELQDKLNVYNKRFSILLQKNRVYKNHIRFFKRKLKMLENEVKTLKLADKQHVSTKMLNSILNVDQIESLKRKSTKFMKWSNETIKRALKLKVLCGSNGYEELIKQNMPLPSIRTLQRYLKNSNFDS